MYIDLNLNTYGLLTDPYGILLHSSRSGRIWTTRQEFDSTRGYARRGADGLFWNATVGEGAYSLHYDRNRPVPWGYNARGASRYYYAIELAQPRLGDPITDELVDTAATCIVLEVLPHYLGMDLRSAFLPEHWELPEGKADGKTDVWYGQPGQLAAWVRARALGLVGG